MIPYPFTNTLTREQKKFNKLYLLLESERGIGILKAMWRAYFTQASGLQISITFLTT